MWHPLLAFTLHSSACVPGTSQSSTATNSPYIAQLVNVREVQCEFWLFAYSYLLCILPMALLSVDWCKIFDGGYILGRLEQPSELPAYTLDSYISCDFWRCWQQILSVLYNYVSRHEQASQFQWSHYVFQQPVHWPRRSVVQYSVPLHIHTQDLCLAVNSIATAITQQLLNTWIGEPLCLHGHLHKGTMHIPGAAFNESKEVLCEQTWTDSTSKCIFDPITFFI